jgi:hypothetical protein
MKILKTYEKFIRKENLNDIYDKYYSEIPFETFQKIVESDPTSLIDGELYMGKYCKWLLKLYTSKSLKLEDLYKVPEYLLLFDKQTVRNKLPLNLRNINNFKSLGDLAEVVSDFKPEEIMSKKEIKEDNLVEEFENYKLYIPKDYKDSCILGKGTEWCTATEKTDYHFRQYHKHGRELLIFISKKNPKIKYQFHFRTEQFMDKFDNSINIHNFLKDNPDIDSWLKLNVKDYKKINTVNNIRWRSSNFDDCPEKIEGCFNCNYNQLTSLIGGPKIIEGNFNCSNNLLTSLEGCPKIVEGDFDCDNNQLTSLEVCPKKIEGFFNCEDNNLTSLKGCPEVIDESFYCSNNKLKSLEGCPKIVEEHFICNHNKLTSLKGCPESIKGNFGCRDNNLKTLEGGPKTVEKNFDCSMNPLTTLIGCPEIVNDFFTCTYTNLSSLEGCPKIIGSYADFRNNTSLTDKDFEWLEKNCKIGGQILR